MPEFDPTSRYAHLIELAWDYQDIIDQADDPSFTMEELSILNSQRSVLHDQIIAELERLGEPAKDRTAAMQFALRAARWMPRSGDDYDI